jgi:acyl-coenzyme A thioesterase PaaI-like protein
MNRPEVPGSPPGAGTQRRGALPLEQTQTLAPLIRQVVGQALALDEEHPAVDALIDRLGQTVSILQPIMPSDLSPRREAGTPGRVYLDHSRDIASYNPCFPQFELTAVLPDHATGVVTFPLPFEGPPGIVHGGFISLLFDAAVQEHNCALGVAGKTASLQVEFLRPAPLLKPLDLELQRETSGRRSTTQVWLVADGEVCSKGSIVLVVGDRAKLAPVDARRSPS